MAWFTHLGSHYHCCSDYGGFGLALEEADGSGVLYLEHHKSVFLEDVLFFWNIDQYRLYTVQKHRVWSRMGLNLALSFTTSCVTFDKLLILSVL